MLKNTLNQSHWGYKKGPYYKSYVKVELPYGVKPAPGMLILVLKEIFQVLVLGGQVLVLVLGGQVLVLEGQVLILVLVV